MRPEPFRREHAELVSHLEHLGQAARSAAADDRGDEAVVGRVLGFLRDTLVPHAGGSLSRMGEAHRLRRCGRPDGPRPRGRSSRGSIGWPSTDLEDVDTVQELLYGLYALISVHFRKEEDLQLPAFDAAPPEVTEAVLERMGALAGHPHTHT